MKSSIVRAAAVAAVAAVFLGLGASAAVAVTTPTPGALSTGSALYAIDCDNGPAGQLYSVDVSDATGTRIGSGSDINGSVCAGSGAWDYQTNTMYYTSYGTGPTPYALASVDLSTGVSTSPGLFLSGATSEQVGSIAIGVDGSAYAIDSDGELYSLDLSSGALTPVAATGDTEVSGFAADPVSGAYYVLDYSTGVYSTIDVSTGAITAAGTLSLTATNGVEALQIDSNGTFWIQSDGTDADIWSFDPANPAGAVESGVFTLSGTQVYTETLLLSSSAAPTITSSAPPASVPVSTPYSFAVAASGAGPITFTITAGALPTGLTLDSATGVISGTPTTLGSYSYTVTATNSVDTTSASYTQAVAAVVHLPIVSG